MTDKRFSSPSAVPGVRPPWTPALQGAARRPCTTIPAAGDGGLGRVTASGTVRAREVPISGTTWKGSLGSRVAEGKPEDAGPDRRLYPVTDLGLPDTRANIFSFLGTWV